jgi:hypothetical protein
MMYMFWTFKFSFDVDILASLGFGDCFGYFFKKLGDQLPFNRKFFVRYFLNETSG